jgi:hypothetical protein
MLPRTLLALIAAGLLASIFGAWWLTRRSTSEPVRLARTPLDLPAESTDHEPLARAAEITRVVSRAPPAEPAHHPDRPAEFMGFTGPAHIVGHLSSQSDHTPIAGATISASWLGERPRGCSAGPTIGGSDQQGRYEFVQMAAGIWELTCVAKGFERQVKVVQLPDRNDEVPFDFALAPARALPIVVHIRCPDGRALTDAADRSGDKELLFHLRIVCTDACPPSRAALPGSVRILPSQAKSFRPDSRLPKKSGASDDSWFSVELEHDGTGCCCLVLGKHVLEVAPFDASTKRIDMIVSMDDVRRWTASVRVRVVDASTGAPMNHVDVCVRSAAGDRSQGGTDATGSAFLVNVIAGDDVLDVDVPSYARSTQAVFIRPNIENDLHVVKLHPKVTVSGTLEWPRQVELPKPVVWTYRVDEGEELSRPQAYPPSSMNSGAFQFVGVDPGIYLVGWQATATSPPVSAVRDGKVPGWRYVDARSGDVSGVEIVLDEAMARQMQEDTRSHR